MILLLALAVCSCDINNDNDDVPPPSLPPTVYGQLPTRNAIIQAAEAVGAVNVQINYYTRSTGTVVRSFTLIVNGIARPIYRHVHANTDGGYQPGWWRQDRRWSSSDDMPNLVDVGVLYDETGNMHPRWSVEDAIHQLFENAGFVDATRGDRWGNICFVETTTDNRWRLIPLPTHASIMNAVEQSGVSTVHIIHYEARVFSRQEAPSPFLGDYFFRAVPVDGNFFTAQGKIGGRSSNQIILRLSYEYLGLGSIIASNDVEDAIRELFKQYGFEDIEIMNVRATGTDISASFPLPSFNQIRQAIEQAGANNVRVSTYRANNGSVIPLNEGSRLANIPVIVEINYDGPALSAVNANVQALFANFNNVHIGNNVPAAIPLPNDDDIRHAVMRGALFLPNIRRQPEVYTANGIPVTTWWGREPRTWEETVYWLNGGTLPFTIRTTPDAAGWNARMRIVMQGEGADTNTAAVAANARQEIIRVFNERGFFNLDITVNR
jgi:hypothetical protein